VVIDEPATVLQLSLSFLLPSLATIVSIAKLNKSREREKERQHTEKEKRFFSNKNQRDGF